MSLNYQDDLRFCREILPGVSRSFAFNISLLKNDLYRAVLSGYLICRILDTVEDAPDLKPSIKIKLLKAFPKILQHYDQQSIMDWVEQAAVCKADKAEKQLLTSSDRVLRVYSALPPAYQKQLFGPVKRMARGMARMLDRYRRCRHPVLKTEKELEEYCYYVAGTVGEFLTGVFTLKISNREKVRYLRLYMNDFGLALQLTNILKDFQDDHQRNRDYIPQTWFKNFKIKRADFYAWRYPEKNKQLLDHFIRKTADYQQKAFAYLLGLPRRYRRIRLFCAFALLLAVMTVAQISTQSGQKTINHKVSRARVKRLIIQLPFIISSNFLLKLKFNRLFKQIYFQS